MTLTSGIPSSTAVKTAGQTILVPKLLQYGLFPAGAKLQPSNVQTAGRVSWDTAWGDASLSPRLCQITCAACYLTETSIACIFSCYASRYSSVYAIIAAPCITFKRYSFISATIILGAHICTGTFLFAVKIWIAYNLRARDRVLCQDAKLMRSS